MMETVQTWPRRLPLATLLALFFGIAVLPAKVYFAARHWTALQQFYFADFLRSGLPGTGKTGKYRLLQMQTPAEPLFALDDWVVPQQLDKDHPKDAIPFTLSVEGKQHGGLFLRWETLDKANPPMVHAFLQHWVFDDRTLTDLFRRPAVSAAVAILFFVPLGIAKDIRRRRAIQRGYRIRGPELVTRGRFNKIMQSTGVGFQTNEPLDLYERWKDQTQQLRLRENDEFSHFLIIGDSGSGKSSLIRQMLTQIQLRDQPAIVYDPDCQFIRHFYNEKRGDWVLNPIDNRCPYWHPGDEINYIADTVAVASSLFSRDLKEPPFFIDSARDLMAELLRWNPSAADLAHWMAHPEEIDRRIKDTPLEGVVSHNAQGQRMGVLATFNKISAAMNMLPTEAETTRRWSANQWSKERKGWIFVTSTPEAREALRPLHSLWLDTLILRLLGTGQDSEHGVWIVLDELASLQKLPQLHTAITEGRKSKNRITIGIQGSAQLETLYGPMAVTMLSQPSTKILLRTSEPRAAKWMSDTIGEIEIERFRESRQQSYGFGGKSSKTFALERKTEPLISAAQISGLPNMEGYLKSGNYVVKITFPFLALPTRMEGLIRRVLKKVEFRQASELPPLPVKKSKEGEKAEQSGETKPDAKPEAKADEKTETNAPPKPETAPDTQAKTTAEPTPEPTPTAKPAAPSSAEATPAPAVAANGATPHKEPQEGAPLAAPAAPEEPKPAKPPTAMMSKMGSSEATQQQQDTPEQIQLELSPTPIESSSSPDEGKGKQNDSERRKPEDRDREQQQQREQRKEPNQFEQSIVQQP